jgi:polyribonucleotide nucleotidyltransferase
LFGIGVVAGRQESKQRQREKEKSMQPHRVEVPFGEKTFYIETGVLARQAGGSVVVGFEETSLLAAACLEPKPKDNIDFLPLTVDYRDKSSAAGRIPGNFFRREARPSDRETLTSRLVDRSIRPMFAEGYAHETQVTINPLSFDFEHETDLLALNGAAASLLISPAAFSTPIGGVKVGRVNGVLVANPTIAQLEKSDLSLILAGTEESLTMVEGGGDEITEEDLITALEFGHEWIKKICAAMAELAKLAGKEKVIVTPVDHSADVALVFDKMGDAYKEAVRTTGKFERSAAMKAGRDQIVAELAGPDADAARIEELKNAYSTANKKFIRNMILDEGIRADGRRTNEVRQISIAVDALPRTHGSALFTRGETQALVTTTLGSTKDEQTLDMLQGRTTSRFMLHYNFPPYCVGEVKRNMGPGRREIGHGALAERAIAAVVPKDDSFPYTVRVVSDILESNGSSSMASVCGASLSLMDAGVPIKAAVAGIAMGLVAEGERVVVLTDILGLEDSLGDMDFKVAGTRDGITAVQMDIKLKGGLQVSLLHTALAQAKEGRLHILGIMDEAITHPKADVSSYAPRIESIRINPEKIGALIGPGGKVIRGISAETTCEINVDDSGLVTVYSNSKEKMMEAVEMINAICQEAKIGSVYMGIVKKIVDFGAFIEIFPGTEGLCHISEFAYHRIERVEDEAHVGDELLVKVIDVDPSGKIRLSRKEAMEKPEGYVETADSRGRDDRGGRPSGGGRPGGGRDDRGGRPSGGGNRGGGNRSGGGGGRDRGYR